MQQLGTLDPAFVIAWHVQAARECKAREFARAVAACGRMAA